jgi:hypothetical protein
MIRPTLQKFDPLLIFHQCLWISGFFLITALYTVKVSILLFYYHIFSINEKFKIAVKVMLGIITAWFISSFVVRTHIFVGEYIA